MTMPFVRLVASWLDDVEMGLSVYAHVIKDYGARDIVHLDALDADDLDALAFKFEQAGVAPLQAKLIKRKLGEQHHLCAYN